MPKADDFRDKLEMEFESAMADGQHHIDIRSVDLHAKCGDYPSGNGNHRMPACCKVMHAAMGSEDEVLKSPPSGQGASLVIRYRIPRRDRLRRA